MITALDHIAIAVPDLQRAISRFMDDFGLTFEGTQDVAQARTTTAFFPIDGTKTTRHQHPHLKRGRQKLRSR